MIPDAVIQACYQRATKSRALENRVSSVILTVNQNAAIEKDDDSRQFLLTMRTMRPRGSQKKL